MTELPSNIKYIKKWGNHLVLLKATLTGHKVLTAAKNKRFITQPKSEPALEAPKNRFFEKFSDKPINI